MDGSEDEQYFSSDSDKLQEHYRVGPEVDHKGRVIRYQSQEEKEFNFKLRMGDFHQLLGKHSICILPEQD